MHGRDQGTGLSKRQVQRALRTLEGRQVIQVERKVDETGLHELNTYRLNVQSGDKMSPPVETPVSGEMGTPMSLGIETPASTTKQREQKKDNVVDVAKDLGNFGIAQSAITKLLQDYPVVYIKEKLAMAQGLVAARSGLVSQNPAGWLRRAIEEDYTLPKPAERHRWRLVREKKEARRAQAKCREQHTPEEKSQPAQNVATTPYQCPQNVVTPEKQEAEKTEQSCVRRDQRENQVTWDKALEQLKSGLIQEEVAARLAGTTLIEVTDTAARIGVASSFTIPWLERRLYGQIAKALKGVVGRDLDLQFVTSPL